MAAALMKNRIRDLLIMPGSTVLSTIQNHFTILSAEMGIDLFPESRAPLSWLPVCKPGSGDDYMPERRKQQGREST
jgi:hypothetical protein